MSAVGFPGTCRGCGAAIEWVTLNKRWHPANPRELSVIVDGKIVKGRESRFATCPKASTFRRSPLRVRRGRAQQPTEEG